MAPVPLYLLDIFISIFCVTLELLPWFVKSPTNTVHMILFFKKNNIFQLHFDRNFHLYPVPIISINKLVDSLYLINAHAHDSLRLNNNYLTNQSLEKNNSKQL